MERLTKRNKNGQAYYPYCFREDRCGGMGTSDKCDTCGFSRKICEKLAYYEDLEKQGLLLRLPCKVGDNVYAVEEWSDTESLEVFEYIFDGIESDGYRLMSKQSVEDIVVVASDEIGKTVFFSKVEAEKVLKKLDYSGGHVGE